MTFYELEKICKQRRIKKRIFLILLITGVLFTSYLIWNFYKINSKKVIKLHTKKEITKTIEKKEIKKVEKKIKPLQSNKSVNKEKEIILTPVISLNFTDINTSKSQNISKKIKLKKEESPKASSDKVVHQYNIITTETLPSYEECIYKAKKALKNKNYALAFKWAQDANTKNKIRPEAWIISAKILYKTGKKQKAVNILKLYLKYQKNKKIEKFLKELENEK